MGFLVMFFFLLALNVVEFAICGEHCVAWEQTVCPQCRQPTLVDRQSIYYYKGERESGTRERQREEMMMMMHSLHVVCGRLASSYSLLVVASSFIFERPCPISNHWPFIEQNRSVPFFGKYEIQESSSAQSLVRLVSV